MSQTTISHLAVLKEISTGIISTLLVTPVFLGGFTLMITMVIILALYQFAVIIELKLTYDRS